MYCSSSVDLNDIKQCFVLCFHTLSVIARQNVSLFSQTLGTERGLPVWIKVDSDSMGEQLLVCKFHRALT